MNKNNYQNVISKKLKNNDKNIMKKDKKLKEIDF